MATDKNAYLCKRLEELGISENENQVALKTFSEFGDRLKGMKIFRPDADGNIEILLWNLDREVIEYEVERSNEAQYSAERKRNFVLTRLSPENIQKRNEEAWAKGLINYECPKYISPKGQGVYPFFPELLLEKYEKKEAINTLYLTEGYFKAFSACRLGLPVVGITGITTLTDKEKNLHPDIVRIISACAVKNVVMLYDGDCFDISEKAVKRHTDLTTRPQGFYNSACLFQRLLRDTPVNCYFATINTHGLEGHPKGLDDLLASHKGELADIREEMLSVGTHASKYFTKRCINTEKEKKDLRQMFRLNDVAHFYERHQETIQGEEFFFYGTKYQATRTEDGYFKLILLASRELREYIRVGPTYYKIVQKPVPSSDQTYLDYIKWSRAEIELDFSKQQLKHIAHYDDWIWEADNLNFKQVINGCYNRYVPLIWEAQEGTIHNTMNYFRHIFGEQLELGLDYVKLLLETPRQILPILCLVSTERETGKTTFLNYLSRLFQGNTVIASNEDFLSNFNAYMDGKLIVACDEFTMEDAPKITERLKRLSTQEMGLSNGKGTNQRMVTSFAKFILCSNKPTRFIRTDADENRFWIRKIPKLPIENRLPNLPHYLEKEIPAFIHYLTHRPMHTQRMGRAWFDERLLRNEAWAELVADQTPKYERLIKEYVKDYFTDFEGETELKISEKDLLEAVPALNSYKNLLGDAIVRLGGVKATDENGKSKTMRYSFLTMTEGINGGLSTLTSHRIGRPWVFKRIEN